MGLSLFKRLVKGIALTFAEGDQNWTDIENAVNGPVLDAGVSSYTADSKMRINGLVLEDSAEITVKIGTTPGGDEIMGEETFSGPITDLGISKYLDTGDIIYFTGFTSNTITRISRTIFLS